MPDLANTEVEPARPSDMARIWSAAIGTFLLVLVACGSAAFLYENSRMQGRRQASTALTAQLAHDIEEDLNLSLSSTYALASVIRQGNGTVTNFPLLAKEMLELYPGVSALQLAPNGVIAEVYPLEGNRKALGHKLLEDTRRNREAILAWQTKRLTLAGPFELIQGGKAAIGRLPVFLKDGSGERFWGFSIALIRLEDFLKGVDLPLIAQEHSYEISRIHPDTGKKEVFAAAGRPMNDPVTQKVVVPNGEWKVAVEPLRGWYSVGEVIGELLFVLFSSIGCAVGVFWLARQPIVLQRMVGERTRELSEANAKLNNEMMERLHAELALKVSEDKLRSIFASLTDVILILDADGTYVEIAPTSSNGLYRPPEELVGKRIPDVFAPEQAAFFLSTIRGTLSSGRMTSVDYRLSIGGKEVWFTGNVTPLSGSQVVWSARDITQRKLAEEERLKLEKQLLHTQKLESLGVLAGGIAHDFNNILTAIIGNADLAMRKLKPESPAVENLKRIETAAARASDLSRQMLAYSGKGRFVVEELDLNRLVEEMGHMLEVSISKKAQLRYHLKSPIAAVTGDATQIRQVVMNLVINASEAIGDATGVISVTTEDLYLTESYFNDSWLSDPVPEGPYVCLEVADTGCGMDAETLGRIFDPFFTTKFTGRGLGMAAVLGIVRGHKGAIKVKSTPGRGTTFRILFPAEAQAVALAAGEAAASQWLGSGTVLLVDDEEAVRELGGEMLQQLGYQVITACDGRDALELLRGRRDISLVVLDLTMPQMDGGQCLRALREVDSRVRVVLSSGFDEQEVARKFSGEEIAGFLQKPYTLAMMREVLSGAARGKTDPLS